MSNVLDDSGDESESKHNIKQDTTEDERSVVDSYNFAQNYVEDSKKQLWCEITFAVGICYLYVRVQIILRRFVVV